MFQHSTIVEYDAPDQTPSLHQRKTTCTVMLCVYVSVDWLSAFWLQMFMMHDHLQDLTGFNLVYLLRCGWHSLCLSVLVLICAYVFYI